MKNALALAAGIVLGGTTIVLWNMKDQIKHDQEVAEAFGISTEEYYAVMNKAI